MLKRRPSQDEAVFIGSGGAAVSEATTGRSARLQGPAMALERQMAKDNLKHSLEARPSLEQLAENGIYGAPLDEASTPKVAQSLAGPRAQLEMNMKKDMLSRSLSSDERPSLEELKHAGYWHLPDDDYEEDDDDEYEERAYGKGAPSDGGAALEAAVLDQTIQRAKFALALKAVAHLARNGLIDGLGRSYVKELIIRDDPRIQSAVEGFQERGDVSSLLEDFVRLASVPEQA